MLEKLNHLETPIEGGGEIYILDKGEAIDSEAESMLQALHSRSVGGFKHHLKILEEKGAEDFMSKFYVGYGHKSIGDCGSITIFIEGVSMLAAKAIQDHKLYNGQEASTRYLDFSKQPFLSPRGVTDTETILESLRTFYLESLDPIKKHLKEQFPIQEGEKESVYNKAIDARAFDIARGFLPAGAATNLAWHTTLRQVADRIKDFKAHPLKEVQNIGEAILRAVLKKYPNSFSDKEYTETAQWHKEIMEAEYYYHDDSNSPLLKYDLDEDQLALDILRKRPNGKTEIPAFLHSSGNVTAKFRLDFGSYRDIQRHRAISQRMPLLTTDLGFHDFYLDSLPEELKEKTLKYLNDYNNSLEFLESVGLSKFELQYYIPMGYLTTNHFTASVPALVYMLELRATRFVHPTLRILAEEMSVATSKALDIPIFIDKEINRFDIKRGEQDIQIK